MTSREEVRFFKMATVLWRCGCCLRFKFSPEELEQRYRSLEIDRVIEKDKQRLKRQVKLLLLGAGESGKSTFLKQMRIIHGVKFEPEVLKEYQHVIYGNILKGMKVLVDARDKLRIAWQDSSKSEDAAHLMRVAHDGVDYRTFRHIAPALMKLWADQAIKRAYERRSEFQLSDSVQYFFDELPRISSSDYVPSNKDILHARRATKGISEMTIPINNIPFLFVDVGGQRSQRQKWFKCFDSVTSILFLVSTSEFDQVLAEDKQTNRLQESHNIFDTIVNHQIFERVSIILFLNKTDLLERKIAKRESDIRNHFPEYQRDPYDLAQVQAYILQLFTSAKRNPKKQLFHHFTTAVDTEDIKYVFNAVKDTVLHRNLESLMLQ